MIDDVVDEIKRKSNERLVNKVGCEPANENAQAKENKKKAKTKEEIEAYKKKMIAKEEEMYLGKRTRKSRKKKCVHDLENKKPVSRRRKAKKEEVEQVSVVKPKMLQPIQPLFLLHIPGLAKGDGIVICLAHGVEQ